MIALFPNNSNEMLHFDNFFTIIILTLAVRNSSVAYPKFYFQSFNVQYEKKSFENNF